MRILVMGNSGSGKSTFAAREAAAHNLDHLDLDTLVWEPEQIAVVRPPAEIRADLAAFVTARDAWIIEGCYGDLVEAVVPQCTELVFLDPGEAACLANCRNRPWEPHKYPSREAQDERLPFLLAWVAGYYTRDDAWSLAGHRRVFDAFTGPKRRLVERP